MAKYYKNAPHLNDNTNPFTELFILAGSQAWQMWGKGKGIEWDLLAQATNTPASQKPVILGESQLNELQNLKIAHKEQAYIRIFQCGELTQAQITAICHNIAESTQADSVKLCDSLGELKENLSNYIQRIRKGETNAEIIAQHAIDPQNDDKTAQTTPYIEERTEQGEKGLFYVIPKIDKQTGERTGEVLKWLSSPVQVIGEGATDTDSYLVLQFTPQHKTEPVIEAIASANLGEREGWRQLRQKGLKITSETKTRAILADYLMRGIRPNWTLTNRTGWQGGAYLLPNGETLGTTEKPVLFVGRSAGGRGYTQAGNVASWREHIADNIKGNPSMMTACAVALSAPLIGILEADSFGVHLFGGSSTGKTTTANVASSIYGHPEHTRLTWYSTAYGILNEALAHNDGFLTLDEIGQGSSIKDVNTTAYALFNGVGKIQGAREGGNRDLMRWRTVAFSTGEKDVETFLQAGGINVKAGQLIRLLNIPIRKAHIFHQYSNAKAHADALNEATRQHYGAIGREWINKLNEQQENARKVYRTLKVKWAERVPQEADPQVYRVADRFAIMETALQLAQPLTGWQEWENNEALICAFNDWLAMYGVKSKESEQVIEQFTGWLIKYSESRFIEIPDNPYRTIQEVAGYRVLATDKTDEHFYLFPHAFTEATNGYPKMQACEILLNVGILQRGKEAQYKYLNRIPKKHDPKRQRAYFIILPSETDEEAE